MPTPSSTLRDRPPPRLRGGPAAATGRTPSSPCSCCCSPRSRPMPSATGSPARAGWLRRRAPRGRRSRSSTWCSTGRGAPSSTSCSTSRSARGKVGAGARPPRRPRSSPPWAAPGSGRTPTLCASSRAAGSRWRAEYEITLDPARLLKAGPDLQGRRPSSRWSPTASWSRRSRRSRSRRSRARGRSSSAGTIRFNYPVDPEVLATKVKLIDPALGECQPLEVELETSWQDQSIGFRTEPVQKQRGRADAAASSSRATLDAAERQRRPWARTSRHEIPLGSRTKLAVLGVEADPGDRESTIRIVLLLAGLRRGRRQVPDGRAARSPSAPRRSGNVLSLTGRLPSRGPPTS